jgi:hypothetical protein
MRPTTPVSNHKTNPQGTKKLSINSASQLIEEHPLLLWGGAWIVIVLVGVIAVGGLLSPGMPGRRASSAAFGSSTGSGEEQVTKQPKSVPFWLFGAIAVTCTAGSILVSKRLAQVERPQKLSRRKRPVKYAAGSPRRSAPAKPAQRKRLKPFSEQEIQFSAASNPYASPRASAAPIPFKPPPVVKRNPKSASKKGTVQVPVTVVPSDENHPLDWNDASLAHLMDIRKRRSLSSWM